MVQNKTVACYTIDDISNWLKENKNSLNQKIVLPSLQRGFVWKAHQIESLWDSILRGYPIGSLLVNEVSESKKELLDGQQRCTSISIGYLDFLNAIQPQEIFNIKSNIPSVWLDLKPPKNSIYKLKFGLRVLTRSHPWGYQLGDNKKRLSTTDINNALTFFRSKASDKNVSFSKLKTTETNPWDAYYPVPLFVLLNSDATSFKKWSNQVTAFIKVNLNKIKTKHSNSDYVNYNDIEIYLIEVYNAIVKAKDILIPEIPIKNELLNEQEDDENEDSDDATLFIRLNAEGTKISGEELVYSLLKSTFPEAKTLVEKIDAKYLAPSIIVNLFARLSLMQVNGFSSYQKSMNLTGFRRNFNNDKFKNTLINFIKEEDDEEGSKATQLFKRALSIVSFNKELPKVYIKNQINSSLDLFFVLLVYLLNNENLSKEEEKTLHKDFHIITLFNENSRKTAVKFFDTLKSLNFKNWNKSVLNLRAYHSNLALPILTSEDFITINKIMLQEYLINRSTHFYDKDFLKNIFKKYRTELPSLFFDTPRQSEETEEVFNFRVLEQSVNYWINFSKKVLWNKTFLLLAQRDYFNHEFTDYMEFDAIEDTNRPWDWDHIYPNSWVYSKKQISPLVKHMLNTNGNFRALSFNENRSEGNSQSPKFRFEDKITTQKNSFIKANDLAYWLELSNEENRLKEGVHNNKIDAFVTASFYRINNIYEEVFMLFNI